MLCADLCNDTSEAMAGSGIESESDSSTSLPIVIYSHGLGGMCSDNSTLCCDLASHGYVAAAVDHR